jgi:hypothetical protein
MPLRSPSQSSVTESVPSCQSFLANTKQRLYNTLKENRIIGASNSIKKKKPYYILEAKFLKKTWKLHGMKKKHTMLQTKIR